MKSRDWNLYFQFEPLSGLLEGDNWQNKILCSPLRILKLQLSNLLDEMKEDSEVLMKYLVGVLITFR